MEHVTGFEQWLLDKLNPEQTMSAEDFIIGIEEQLDAGELSEDEAILLIQDFML